MIDCSFIPSPEKQLIELLSTIFILDNFMNIDFDSF